MELLINELSLKGQFNSIEEFINIALPPLLSVLKDTDSSRDLLYKKYDFYSSLVTPQNTLHDVVVGPISRQYDEIRKFKTQLVGLFENPFWEDSPKHSFNDSYYFLENKITGSSLAEACERDKIAISFICNEFNNNTLDVIKEKNTITVDNLFEKEHCLEVFKQRNFISFEHYCKSKFHESKLDFSQLYVKDGFDLIGKDDEELFYDGFRKFDELTWSQINVDDSLDFKEFNNKNYFKEIEGKIHKFRISKKYRCFGYVKNGKFHALLFDLNHKLSDKG